MAPASQKTTVCPNCGLLIETTGSGDVGCLICAISAALDGSASEPGDEVPESIGPYRIRRHSDGSPHILGRGTMGITYCAEDVSLRRDVALKLISEPFAARGVEARERFLREARAAASLRHPNVATIYQFGIDDWTGRCFSAMEYVEGETLEERVRNQGPLEVNEVLTIARQVASALVAAEERHLLHRDLKPANIMVTAKDGTVKIIDFGLAKAFDEAPDARILTEGGFIGTPAFASPEQLRRDTLGLRSDIYSLGATLLYLLTGKMPSDEKEPSPIAQLKAARVPLAFIALVVSMLAPEPASRPRPAEIIARLTSVPRRNFTLVWVAAAAVVLLLALAAAEYFYFKPRAVRVAASPAPAATPVLAAKSVAVLPFEELSGEKEAAGFAAGVHDALLTDLAHIADLKVVSRTSVLQYRGGQSRNLRQIARELGVAYIVEGTIQTLGKKMRLSAQLIDARSDAHRWAQTYDRSLDDLFVLESDIAQTIADQLHAKISPPEKAAIEEAPTHDLAAYDLYTHANQLLAGASTTPRGKHNLFEAAQLLGEAVARDPSFLLAWCQLANTHDTLYYLGFDRVPVRLSLGESALEAARKLQPDAGETHLAQARHFYHALAYDDALRELAMARRILPNEAGVYRLSGFIARRRGKWKESTRELEKALALDPRNTRTLEQVAHSFRLQRLYGDAANFLDRALLIAPDNVELRVARAMVDLDGTGETRPLHAVLATVLAKDPAAALDVAEASLTLALCERDPAAIASAIDALGDGNLGPDAIQLRRSFWKGLAARMVGNQAGAKSAFAEARAEQQRKVAAAPDFAPALSILALIDAGLGKKADAIREAQSAVEMLPVARDAVNGAHLLEFLAMVNAWSGEPETACDQLKAVARIPGGLSYGQLKVSPMWDDLRGNPRFEKIVASLAPAP